MTEAIHEHPDDPNLYFTRARLYAELRQYGRARADVRRACGTANSAECAFQQASLWSVQGRRRQAFDLLWSELSNADTAVGYRPTLTLFAARLAVDLHDERAQNLFEQALRSLPPTSLVFLEYVDFLSTRFGAARALDVLRTQIQHLRTRDEMVPIVFSLRVADLSVATAQPILGADELRQAQSQTPSDDLNLRYADLLALGGAHTHAHAVYAHVLTQLDDPARQFSAFLLANRAHALLGLGRIAEASRYIERAYQHVPREAQIQSLRARIRRAQGRRPREDTGQLPGQLSGQLPGQLTGATP